MSILVPPKNLATASVQPRQIVLTWSHPLAGITGFRLMRSLDRGTTWIEQARLPLVLSHLATGLIPGQTYLFRIQAVHAPTNRESAWTLLPVPVNTPQVAPAAPTNLRVVSATPTGRTFTRPAKFELQKLLRDSFGVRSKEGDFEVVIRFESSVADYLREKRWHPSQVVEELEDGGVEVRLRLGSLLEIERWILSWGGTARVMAPPELIERVRGAAVRLQESHPLAGGARTRPAAGA